MLPGQQLRGRHPDGLILTLHRHRRGIRRHHRFPATNLSLQQPQHRRRPAQIFRHLLDHPPLAVRQGEWQALDKRPGQRSLELIAARFAASHPSRPPQGQPQLHAEQLFEDQSLPRLLQLVPRLRKMQLLKGLCNGRQMIALAQAGRQDFLKVAAMPVQGRPNHGAEPPLVEPFRQRIHRHDAPDVQTKLAGLAIEPLQLRVDELQPTARQLRLPIEDVLLADFQLVEQIRLMEPHAGNGPGPVAGRRLEQGAARAHPADLDVQEPDPDRDGLTRH